MKPTTLLPADLKVLCNHIYEYKKGVRNLVLYTLNSKYADHAIQRLKGQDIKYLTQPAGNNINLFFGEPECLDAIRTFIDRPLNKLTPEQDFILGALLGYNICRQCKRFCERKNAFAVAS